MMTDVAAQKDPREGAYRDYQAKSRKCVVRAPLSLLANWPGLT